MRFVYGFLVCFSFLIFPSNIYSQNNTRSYIINDYHVATTLAKDSGMPILLIFTADWCGYCTVLKKDMINFKEIDNYIVCVVDIEQDSLGIKNKMRVKNLPTSIIIDAKNDTEISRKVGYKAADYKKWLDNKTN